MVRMCVLASGSRGNSTLVCTDSEALLIDAGISAAKISAYLETLQINPFKLKGIVITHEHTDHIRGVGPLSRKYGVPVFCNIDTWAKAKSVVGNVPSLIGIEPGAPFSICDFRIVPFSTPHDALNPIGLTVEVLGKKIGIATDLGYVTRLIRERLRGCHALMLEFNYNRDMLIAGPYTWPMKQRIMGRMGHLSNEDACSLLEDVITPELSHIVLAHMSENNNLPELALMSVRDVCIKNSLEHITVIAGRQGERSDWINLD